MKLSSLIDPHLVVTGASVANLDEAAGAAIRTMSEHYRDSVSFDAALAAIRARVSLGGTVLPGGLAIPHARLPGFDDILIAPVIPRAPLGEAGQEPVRIVWVMLLGTGTATLYVKVLSVIAKVAADKALTAALLAAENGPAFVDVLEKSGLKVEKDLHIADVMTSPAVSIPVDASVKELLDLMFSRSIHYLPVVEAGDRLVGELSVLDVIDASIPDYARRISNLKFMDELQPMEQFLASEETMKVREIMKPLNGVLAPADSIVDLAAKMAKTRKRHFPVAEGGRLVGIVSATDILAKVLRA